MRAGKFIVSATLITSSLVFVAAFEMGSAGAMTTTTSNGTTKTVLAQANPANAPGQTLYLYRVTIAPGAALPTHFHEGTQLAYIQAGVLTYNIISGTVAVTNSQGATKRFKGPTVVSLSPGYTLTETPSVVHYGSNKGKSPVVIELSALIEGGAPLATATDEKSSQPLVIASSLHSISTALHQPTTSITYGWNHLEGTATVAGKQVDVDFQGSVNYLNGSGDFSGFVTFTFAKGVILAMTVQGVAAANRSATSFSGTMGIITGTGQYAHDLGTGTFIGHRTSALGSPVAATFSLSLMGS
jgi:hypothetical protein